MKQCMKRIDMGSNGRKPGRPAGLMVVLAMMLVLMMALTGCGGEGGAPQEKEADDQGGAPVESQEAKDEGESAPAEKTDGEKSASKSKDKIELTKDGKVVLLESGYGYDSEFGYLQVGALIADTNSENAYEYPGISVTAYAEDGSILAVGEETLDRMQPGEKLPVCTVLDTKKKEPKKVEIKEIQGDEAEPDSAAIKTTDLVYSNVTEHYDKEFGELSYTGELTNKSQSDSEEVHIYVLLRNKGKIVWANEAYDAITDLPKNEKKAFDFSFYPKADHDSYEIYAIDGTY